VSPSTTGVTITTHPMWRVRLARELPRYLIWTLALSGLAASARFAIAPPRAPRAKLAPVTPSADRAAEAYAVLFTRRYLTWNAAEPLGNSKALRSFIGNGASSTADVQLPPEGTQTVEWAEVAQEREPQPGEHVYTVAAQTHPSGLLYLTVTVQRLQGGALTLTSAPAFVGPPASTVQPPPARQPPAVEERGLEVVVRRALTNYLSGSAGELAADLAGTARVSLPTVQLALHDMTRLTWAPGGGAVVAVVQVSDPRGAAYTLAYEVDVTRTQGRWEISAVQMDPDAP
jgi:hypothetical protein